MEDKIIDFNNKSIENFDLNIDEFAQQIYVTGAIGSSTDLDIRLLIVNDKIVNTNGSIETKKESNLHLIMNPEVTQQIIDLLQRNLDDYYSIKNKE
ncbi:hypothetical protein KQY27_02410 [Methanobrevibacter sp. TMH8]|uniref:DUF3467 domain-containing protein n=1 Tax=Methanobrevibacter sp. TMH8 TaxID=2848611 RepID=UPI001CCB2451|nr:DUF3467 domain-containing protein [Methanobrevibacter sp. TMH8]MBZ9570396.1 hypothetical protein [Methanobrevibacter sp. TMH8]